MLLHYICNVLLAGYIFSLSYSLLVQRFPELSVFTHPPAPISFSSSHLLHLLKSRVMATYSHVSLCIPTFFSFSFVLLSVISKFLSVTPSLPFLPLFRKPFLLLVLLFFHLLHLLPPDAVTQGMSPSMHKLAA